MGIRIYNITCSCGCLIAEDTGTPEEPNGDAGMIPCFSDNCKAEEEYFSKRRKRCKGNEN
jgi:hypothetical protein